MRRFYDPSEENFNGRRIARDAFLSGNDLLFLSQFALSNDWEEQIANVKSTITFFHEKYTTEPSFQTLVDAAVARILRLKLALHGDKFDLALAQPDVETVSEQVGFHPEALSAIAHDAITLLTPPSPDLVPAPPTFKDNIVIFTDSRKGRPCATCETVPYVDPQALRDTILRLYGPHATGQINPTLVTSFTFEQLEAYMNMPPQPPTPTPAASETVTPTMPHPVEVALQNSDWIIFAILKPTADLPQSGVVRRFLSERANALRGSHLIVLAYDAPYYLDTTEISKLSAYYVAYSRIDRFIEASVRALFGEFPPTGSPPVSVPGINYNLLVQTSPDPDQTLVLYYEISETTKEGEPTPESTAEVEPSPEPTVEGQPTPPPPQPGVGDVLKLRTGTIVDHNGHPVPDGTPVQFIFTYPREGLEHSIVEMTRKGVAETTITLERTGQLDISLQADPAPRTIVLQITVPEGEPATIWTPTPVPSPTPTVTPTPTAEPAPAPEETPTPTPDLEEREQPPVTDDSVGWQDLALALLGVSIVGSAGYYTARLNGGPVSRALRIALWSVVGGLVLYLAYALGFPGVAWFRERGSIWAAGWVVLLGGGGAWILAWIASQQRRRVVKLSQHSDQYSKE